MFYVGQIFTEMTYFETAYAGLKFVKRLKKNLFQDVFELSNKVALLVFGFQTFILPFPLTCLVKFSVNSNKWQLHFCSIIYFFYLNLQRMSLWSPVYLLLVISLFCRF